MADPAPVPRKRPTETTTLDARSVHTDDLPGAQRMAVATAVSDDPGWLGIHGARTRADYGPTGPSNEHQGRDIWRGSRRQRIEVPVGGVLVCRTAERSTEKRGWNIWRVLPKGPVAVLEERVDDDTGGGERTAIARAIDRDIHEAFEQAACALEKEDGEKSALARAGIEAWKRAEAKRLAERGTGRNRARRRQGR